LGPRESCFDVRAQGYGDELVVSRAWDRRETRGEQVFDNTELVTVILVGWPDVFILRLLDKNRGYFYHQFFVI